MKEDFLHYVWLHQYFDKQQLICSTGEAIQVIRTGLLNTNAGPDFLDAQVKIGQETWNGSVEVHLKASDWLRHQHQTDPRYDQVVLHVVWEDDQPLRRTDGSFIPTIALQERVQLNLLENYLNLKKEKPTIPCSPFINQVPGLPVMQMLDRVLIERLEQKARRITDLLQRNTQDWEETTYQALVSNFGFKINQVPFLQLSQLLPFAIIRKHSGQLWQLEALLYGQAGFLQDVPAEDDYLQKLQQEYIYLWHKYKLTAGMPVAAWNFLRLRPANFPTVRLAQLAALLQDKNHLFSLLLTLPDLPAYLRFLGSEVSPYWQKHYMPGRESKTLALEMGQESKINLLINTVVPLLFAFGRYHDKQELIDKAIALLESLPAEKNNITRIYTGLGLKNKAAADSQAYIQLNHSYCEPRHCLYCSVGHYILRTKLASP